MLADILHKRPTEIDTIVGAVLKRAAKRGKTLPILTTLYHLIVAIEESGEKM
jgi:ketopantoate reductase (EC 1.1.1.169)